MKKLLLFACLAVSTLLGCTVNKDFSVSLDKELFVNFNGMNYTKSDTLDAGKSSSDYAKYKADISSVDVQSASYEITSFLGSTTQKIVSGTLSVSDKAGTTTKTLATVSDVNLSSHLNVETPLTLTSDGTQFLKDQLQGTTSAAVITFSGSTNEAPINFTVKFHMNLKVTYSKTLP